MSNTLKVCTAYMFSIVCFVLLRIASALGIFENFTGYLGDLSITAITQLFCLFLLPLMVYKFLSSDSLSFKDIFKDFSFKKITKNTIFICFILGIFGYILNVCVSSLWSLFLSLLGYASRSSSIASTTTHISFIQFLIYFLSTAILPAICEEFLHRGMLLYGIKKEHNTIFSVIIVGIIFGLLHLNIYQTGYATFLGIIMGILTIITGSIYPAIIIHFVNNGINVIFDCLYTNYYESFFKEIFSYIYQNFISKYSILLVVIGIMLIFVIIWLFIRLSIKIMKNEKFSEDQDLSTNDIILAMIYSQNDMTINNLSTYEKVKLELTQLKLKSIISPNKNLPKLEFKDYIVFILILFLGSLITFFTFIWGLL